MTPFDHTPDPRCWTGSGNAVCHITGQAGRTDRIPAITWQKNVSIFLQLNFDLSLKFLFWKTHFLGKLNRKALQNVARKLKMLSLYISLPKCFSLHWESSRPWTTRLSAAQLSNPPPNRELLTYTWIVWSEDEEQIDAERGQLQKDAPEGNSA